MMQRKNPLPKGRYWIDVFNRLAPQGIAAFEDWLKRNHDLVVVEKRESFGDVALLNIPPNRVWYLFRVASEPGPIFPQSTHGYPTIAEDAVQKPDDTAQKPAQATAADILNESLPDVSTLTTAALVIGLLWVLSRK